MLFRQVIAVSMIFTGCGHPSNDFSQIKDSEPVSLVGTWGSCDVIDESTYGFTGYNFADDGKGVMLTAAYADENCTRLKTVANGAAFDPMVFRFEYTVTLFEVVHHIDYVFKHAMPDGTEYEQPSYRSFRVENNLFFESTLEMTEDMLPSDLSPATRGSTFGRAMVRRDSLPPY